MLTTQCIFHITHDGTDHKVIFFTRLGTTDIFIKDQCVLSTFFVCEDRKAAELLVQVYRRAFNLTKKQS
jgi:hypothetical protein